MQMKLLRMTALNAAMLAGIAAIMSVPATERAEAACGIDAAILRPLARRRRIRGLDQNMFRPGGRPSHPP
jgi:hypothetical protein